MQNKHAQISNDDVSAISKYVPNQISTQHFKLNFPNAESIPFEYYTDQRYNDLRRSKLMLFLECLADTALYRDIQNINKKRKAVESLLTRMNFPPITIRVSTDYAHKAIYSKLYVAECMERSCLNRAIAKSRDYNIRAIWENLKFQDLYHDICYKIAVNVDPRSIINSLHLKTQIINQTVSLKDIANLFGKQLCPEKYEKLDKKINQRVNQEVKVRYSTLYRCFRCKNNKCTSERVYNRSLDEGVNLRIRCTVCYNEWGA